MRCVMVFTSNWFMVCWKKRRATRVNGNIGFSIGCPIVVLLV